MLRQREILAPSSAVNCTGGGEAGKKIVCNRVPYCGFGKELQSVAGFYRLILNQHLTTSTFFSPCKNRSAILTLLRRTCPRGQAAPSQHLTQLPQPQVCAPPGPALPKGTSLTFLTLCNSLHPFAVPRGSPQQSQPNIYAA